MLRYYEDSAAGVADVGRFPDYLGTHELEGQSEVVSLQDGKLYLTRSARKPVELVPEASDIFFRRGVEGRILFDREGRRVDSLIDRRNNEDVVWKKVQCLVGNTELMNGNGLSRLG